MVSFELWRAWSPRPFKFHHPVSAAFVSSCLWALFGLGGRKTILFIVMAQIAAQCRKITILFPLSQLCLSSKGGRASCGRGWERRRRDTWLDVRGFVPGCHDTAAVPGASASAIRW